MKKIILLIGIIGLLLISGCNNRIDIDRLAELVYSDKGDYDYCVEWDGGFITRDNLYHLTQTKYMSNNSTIFIWWSVNTDTNELIFHERIDNTDEIRVIDRWNCTRYVKSVTLDRRVYIGG